VKGLPGRSVYVAHYDRTDGGARGGGVARAQTEGEYLLLPLKGKPVQNKDPSRQNEAGHLARVEGDAQEVQSATPVHGGPGDVEREAGDRGIHENAEIITQVGAGDAESPHASQDEHRAEAEEGITKQGLVDWGIEGLVCQRQLEQVVTEDAEGEDGEGEEVASVVGATEYTGHKVVAVLYRRGGVQRQYIRWRWWFCGGRGPRRPGRLGSRDQPARATMLIRC
jgi:hypothetical protein